MIELKDYALSIERNMNEISLERQQNISFYDNNNLNFELNNNRELLNNMKNMINRIDTRLLNKDFNYPC